MYYVLFPPMRRGSNGIVMKQKTLSEVKSTIETSIQIRMKKEGSDSISFEDYTIFKGEEIHIKKIDYKIEVTLSEEKDQFHPEDGVELYEEQQNEN